jgi:hypothetical protein
MFAAPVITAFRRVAGTVVCAAAPVVPLRAAAQGSVVAARLKISPDLSTPLGERLRAALSSRASDPASQADRHAPGER